MSTNEEFIDLTVSDDEDYDNKVNNFKCQTYITSRGNRVTIDDSKQKCSSSFNTFHSKYAVGFDLFESEKTTVFIGKNKFIATSESDVAIKVFRVEDYRRYLKENIPEEVIHQQNAEEVSVQNGKGTVLKVLDWYVYDKYIIFVTEYDKDYKCLAECTLNQPGEHFSEQDCKIIFRLLFELVFDLNESGIFHLDLKPQNVLYNVKQQKIKLIDFGHSITVAPGENPIIKGVCGTKGLQTPQYVKRESCYGKDVDLWGVAQTMFFCLNGYYAFGNSYDVLNKVLDFKEDVSKPAKFLLSKMLAKKVKDRRMTKYQVRRHPWLVN